MISKVSRYLSGDCQVISGIKTAEGIVTCRRMMTDLVIQWGGLKFTQDPNEDKNNERIKDIFDDFTSQPELEKLWGMDKIMEAID